MSGLMVLIPARGQSKGIPRKNIRPIAGKPLITWTIQAALACERVATVVVSTEDAEIAEIARAAGAEVPFMRPAALATDEAPGIAPVLHAIEALPQYEGVLLLQPTSPLRGLEDINGLLNLVRESDAPSAVSVCPVSEHPAWMFSRSERGDLVPFLEGPRPIRRQDMQDLFVLNGAMYFARRSWLLAHQSFVGDETLSYVMPVVRSIDIDTPFDWQVAEMLLTGAARGAG